MAISNLTQGARPGICTSTSRPTNPYEGFLIYETDTDKVLVWNGSAWLYSSTPQTTEIGAWQAWTPTITPSSGSITSYTVNNARYSIVNKIVTCTFDVTITSVGSAGGVCFITLPVNSSTAMLGGSCGTWRERSVTGDMGFIIKNNSTSVFATRYDQTAIFNTGRTFSGTFTYESA